MKTKKKTKAPKRRPVAARSQRRDRVPATTREAQVDEVQEMRADDDGMPPVDEDQRPPA